MTSKNQRPQMNAYQQVKLTKLVVSGIIKWFVMFPFFIIGTFMVLCIFWSLAQPKATVYSDNVISATNIDISADKIAEFGISLKFGGRASLGGQQCSHKRNTAYVTGDKNQLHKTEWVQINDCK